MINRFVFISLLLILPLRGFPQEKTIPISFTIFNNGSTLPGSGYLGIFSKTIHPGFSLGTYFLYHKGNKHEFFQTVKLGYFYHRFSQQAIQLYSEAGYRYLTKSGLYGEGLLGLGYLHSIPDVQIFKLEDGKYVKKHNFGRPQLMISTGIAVGYDFSKHSSLPLRLYLLYQFWMQTPFVNKYVPLLPNTALHLGISYQLHKKKN
jgi:hypothetical protein